jgi:hypothetical protein
VLRLSTYNMHVGDPEALAAALDRGALPRLRILFLTKAAIGDAALVALAPALRRRPELDTIYLFDNPLGDEGLAALVAPPPPAGTPLLPTGGLKKLRTLELDLGYEGARPRQDPGLRRRVRRPRRRARQRRAACARGPRAR